MFGWGFLARRNQFSQRNLIPLLLVWLGRTIVKGFNAMTHQYERNG
jgi:hypothetical protein